MSLRMNENPDAPVVILHHGCIKFTKSNKNGDSGLYTFYPSGDLDELPTITLYRPQFCLLMTCIKQNFDAIVTQALECSKVLCSKENDPNFDNKFDEEEELLDMQVLNWYNSNGYVPGRVILKSSIYRGRLKLWVVRQWLKRPEFEDKYQPPPGTMYTHVDELEDPDWKPCKGAFCIEPQKKELNALVAFQNKVNNIYKLQQETKKRDFNIKKRKRSDSVSESKKKRQQVTPPSPPASDEAEPETEDATASEEEASEGGNEVVDEGPVAVDVANLPDTQLME